MDFYTVLDQVLVLLRQRGRVSYRALKRQFQLDDETLADLTAELLYAHHPVGEEGSGLVWLGDTSTASVRSFACAPAGNIPFRAWYTRYSECLPSYHSASP